MLGSPFCELGFFSRLDLFVVAQGGLELTEIHLPLFPETWD